MPRGVAAADAPAGNGPAPAGTAIAEKGGAPPVLPGKAFSGSLADLLRIAREAGDHNRAQAKMMMALDDASAADMQRLTAFFPGRLQMTIYPERGG